MVTNSANDTDDDDDEMSPDKAMNIAHQCATDETNDAIELTQSAVSEVAIENAETADDNQQSLHLSLSRMQSVNGSFEKIDEETNEFGVIVGVADVLSSGRQNPAQIDSPSANQKIYAEAVRVESVDDDENIDEPMMEECFGQQNQQANSQSMHGDIRRSDDVHCLQPVAQLVNEIGIDLDPVVSAKPIGDNFGVRNVQQQGQNCRNESGGIGPLERKKCVASLEIHRMDNPNERCAIKKYKFFSAAMKSTAASATDERCNPTVGQMTQKILLEQFETSFDKLIAQFDVQMQICDPDFDDGRFVDMDKHWASELVENGGAYKVLLHPKMDARTGRGGGYECESNQMANRGPPRQQQHEMFGNQTFYEYEESTNVFDQQTAAGGNRSKFGRPSRAPSFSTSNLEQIDRFLLSEVAAPLANLYDTLTDNFVTSNDYAFVNNKMAKNNNNFTVQNRPNLGEQLVEIDSFDDLKERTKILGLDQKLSVISQLAHIDDANPIGQFLHKAAAQTERGNSFGFIKIMPKTTFSLQLGHPKVRDIILQQLPVHNATHFVMSACYGSVVAAIMTFNERTADDKTDISNAKRIVRKFLDGPGLSASDKSLITQLHKSISINIFVDSSIGNCATDLPFINGLNSFADKCATAKGTKHATPISFSLVPLSSIANKTLFNHIPTHMIDGRQFEWFCGHVQTVIENEWQLRKVLRSMDECSSMLTNGQLDNVQQIFQQSEEGKQIFYDSLNAFIGDLRMCKADAPNEEAMQNAVVNYVHFCQRVVGHYEELVNEKKKMLNELKQKGVTYIGRATRQQLDAHFAFDDSNSLALHFILLRNASVLPVQQNEHTSFLLCLGKMFEFVSRGKCTFVELDVLRDGAEAQADDGLPAHIRSLDGYPNIGPLLIKMRGNELLSSDYMTKEEHKLQYPIARIENIRCTEAGAAPQADPKDIQGCILPCPFCEGYGGKCANTDHLWECDDCGQTLNFVKIEKAPITHFFCACGKTPVHGFSFRCSDVEKHGTAFKHFGSEASLDKELDRLNNKNMLTFLLLGETGVGKSTLINAIIAYLKHATLQEALEANTIDWVIPARFCTDQFDSDGNWNKIEVKLGEASAEERLEAGKSQTKSPKAYIIPSKDGHKIRIIDSPGICDTDGIEEDNINFDKTLSFISTLPELHAVCILMRPNSPKLTVALAYCIEQLLTYLHINATKNIIFLFTNARGSNYKMGKTGELLEQVFPPIEQKHNVSIPLHRNRIYCVDNEAFEALCLIKKAGIKYNQDEMDNLSRSWAQAEKEFRRLFKFVSGLEPHRTWETVSINEARRTIIDLSEPLALITGRIQMNLIRIKDCQNAIELGEKELQASPTLESIEFVPLAYPRTVCAANCCTKMQRTITGDVKLYMKHCHEHCYLKDITPERFPNEGLKRCWAMNETGTCTQCGCSWNVHIHYVHDQRQKMFTIEQLEEKLVGDKRKGLSTLENVQKQMLEERGIIYLKSAHLCAFLDKKALKTYNDSMEAYINLSIKQAEKVVSECKGEADQKHQEDKLEGLQESLRLYREQKNLIDSATASNATGPNVITAEDVKQFFDELCELPFFGADIRQMFETKQKARHEHYKEYTEKKTGGIAFKPTRNGKVVQPEQRWNDEQRKLLKAYAKKQKEMDQLEREMEDKNMLQRPIGNYAAAYNQPSASSSSVSLWRGLTEKIPGLNHLFGSSSSQNVPSSSSSSSFGTHSRRNSNNLSSSNYSSYTIWENDRGVLPKYKQGGNYHRRGQQ
ncbi:hypothetical protein niasHS_009173 [Heterodera schachtii]|uniref:DUF8206 domain-containing protein n=1 Tax=Heterodera schachtii TaxID=97005 RepID=A0ABD2JE27_HETSC